MMAGLTQNEKKLMVATLELEQHEKTFDNNTDEIFLKRFAPINKLLTLVLESMTSVDRP